MVEGRDEYLLKPANLAFEGSELMTWEGKHASRIREYIRSIGYRKSSLQVKTSMKIIRLSVLRIEIAGCGWLADMAKDQKRYVIAPPQ